MLKINFVTAGNGSIGTRCHLGINRERHFPAILLSPSDLLVHGRLHKIGVNYTNPGHTLHLHKKIPRDDMQDIIASFYREQSRAEHFSWNPLGKWSWGWKLDMTYINENVWGVFANIKCLQLLFKLIQLVFLRDFYLQSLWLAKLNFSESWEKIS